MPRFLPLFLLFLLFATTSSAANSSSTYYHRAFEAISSNNAEQAEAFAAHGSDPVLNKVIRGYAMALPGNDYSFDQLNSFILSNPGWPGLKGVQMIAEQKLGNNFTPNQTIAWFTTHPPVTLMGFYKFIDALQETGQHQKAQNAITTRWIEGDFTGDDQTAYYNRFANILDSSVMWARMDRLLWKNDDAEARRMMPYLSSSDQALAEARLAFAIQDSHAESGYRVFPLISSMTPDLYISACVATSKIIGTMLPMKFSSIPPQILVTQRLGGIYVRS